MRLTANGVSQALLARAMVVTLIGLAACSGGGTGPAADEGTPPSGSGERSSASSPFTFDEALVPDGFTAVAAGRGEHRPDWSEDCCGSDEPYVVLSPDGTPDHPDVVVVSITGYQGYQGGLDQASVGYGLDSEEVEVAGEEARYSPPGAEHDPDAWADLVVAQGDRDLAIRVTSPDATLEELAALVPLVEVPDDVTQPPAVTAPPGLELVGSVAADAVVAAFPYVDQQADAGPGPTTAHGVGWRQGVSDHGTQVVLMSLPGGSADLAALVVGFRWQQRRYAAPREVVARVVGHHALLERLESEAAGPVRRSVWLPTDDGHLVVAASSGSDAATEEDLLALARSVEPTDTTTWDDFVLEVRGGPGFGADPGRTELMRGPVGDGREWLLQTQPPGEGDMAGSSEDPGSPVDPCLKISDGTRSCSSGGSGSPGGRMVSGRGDDTGVPYTILVSSVPGAVAVRVTRDGETDRVEMVDVPGSDARAAAVIGDDLVAADCVDDLDPEPTGPRTAVVVDAAGVPVVCPPP